MNRRIPWWVMLLALLLALPGGSTPWLVANAGQAAAESKVLLWLYPVYLVASAVLACVCWNQRPWIYWILLSLMLLSTIGIFVIALA